MSKKKKFYAVKKGREIGIYSEWGECSQQIHGYSGALYKSFDTKQEAQKYLSQPDVIESERYETEGDVLAALGDGEMIAYVDGSNLGDGTAFSWGVVLFSNDIDDKKKEISGMSQDERFIRYRNVSGELFASVHAANYAVDCGVKKLTIYHDYSGIRHWALGEWKTKNELSVFYRDYFSSIKDEIDIEFVKADGHSGDRFNEEADVLAKMALGILK